MAILELVYHMYNIYPAYYVPVLVYADHIHCPAHTPSNST